MQNSSNKSLASFLLVIVAVGAGTFLWHNFYGLDDKAEKLQNTIVSIPSNTLEGSEQGRSPSSSDTEKQNDPDNITLSAKKGEDTSWASGLDRPVPAGIPDAFKGFREASIFMQTRRVNEHMYDPDLPDDVRNFFWESLSDKRLARLVRNNIAEALKNQEVKNPILYKTFIDAIDDDGEELDWRLYAIQHLASVYSWSADKGEIEDKLYDLLENGDEEFAAQSMMMLDDLATQESIDLRDSFHLFVEDKVRDESASVASRVSAMSLLGRARNQGDVDLLREYVAAPSAMRRVAIANLGLVGDASDLERLEPFLSDEDPRIVAAAKGAVALLKAKEIDK